MRWSGFALALLVALAGCSNGPRGQAPGPDAEAQEPEQVLGLGSTKTTGLLVGYVVDPALRPLADVLVVISRSGMAEAHTNSTTDGLWGFDGLEPGTYVVRASLPRHLSSQVIASVRADVPDPEPVKLVLEPDLETLPYAVAAAFDGFITCGVRGGTGGVHCGALSQTRGVLGDRSTLLLDVEPGMAWIQAEMLWDATQPLADQMGMYFRLVPREGNDGYMGIYPLNMGPSPLLLAVNATGAGLCSTCIEAPLNMTNWAQLQVDSRSGELSSTSPPETCTPTGTCLAGVGFTLNQRYQLFVHVLYRAGPEPGWQFSVHGPPLGSDP